MKTIPTLSIATLLLLSGCAINENNVKPTQQKPVEKTITNQAVVLKNDNENLDIKELKKAISLLIDQVETLENDNFEDRNLYNQSKMTLDTKIKTIDKDIKKIFSKIDTLNQPKEINNEKEYTYLKEEQRVLEQRVNILENNLDKLKEEKDSLVDTKTSSYSALVLPSVVNVRLLGNIESDVVRLRRQGDIVSIDYCFENEYKKEWCRLSDNKGFIRKNLIAPLDANKPIENIKDTSDKD